jgi:hypothetical protein
MAGTCSPSENQKREIVADTSGGAVPVLRITATAMLAADTLVWLPPEGCHSIERGSRPPIEFVLTLEPTD